MPVLTVLSYLPPSDRVIILEHLLNQDSTNLEIYNKLSLAYLKSGNYQKAISLLDNGKNKQVLDSFNYSALKDKIVTLNRTNSNNPNISKDYNQTLGLLDANKAALSNPFVSTPSLNEFMGIMREFCLKNLK